MQLDASGGHPAATRRGTPGVRSAVATSLAQPVREGDHTEAPLLKSERLFQIAFERAVIGIAHVSPEGRFLRFNQRLCDFLGYSPAELAVRAYQDVTHPDDFEPCMASFQRLLSGEIDEYAMDKRHLRKDGTSVWAHVAVSLVRTPEGAPDFTVTMIQDIDERKRLEQERDHLFAAEQDARRYAEEARVRAQASEMQATEWAECLRTILETMADGVGVVDTEGRLLVANRTYREQFALEHAPAGYEALPGHEWFPLVQVRDAATGAPLAFAESPLGRAVRGEVVRGPSADIRVRACDGRELEINSSAAPLRDQHGRIAGAVGVLRDMTERNRLAREREAARADELAAREANRRMEAFLATAAHDLRTPLAAVVGYLDLAELKSERLAAAVREVIPTFAPHVDAVRARLEDAGEGAQRLTRLLTLLFDTAAMRAGRLEVHRAPCDLLALVREQVEALCVAAPARTIRLHAPAGGESIMVEADMARIGQVVTNYVTNALKYSPQDQPIDVSVEVHGKRARVAVCDWGPGIPKGEQARVWELFHRVPGVTVQNGAPGGTAGGSLGLGLHICKAIIAAHGGRVGIKSAVGQGSTFWFTLPLPSPTSGPAGIAP